MSLYNFARDCYASITDYPFNVEHLEFMCFELEKRLIGDGMDIVVDVMEDGVTYDFASVILPLYLLKRDGHRLLNVANSQAIANRSFIDMKHIDGDIFEARPQKSFARTKSGGHIKSMHPQGVICGLHFDSMIFNFISPYNELEKERYKDWLHQTIATRRVNRNESQVVFFVDSYMEDIDYLGGISINKMDKIYIQR